MDMDRVRIADVITTEYSDFLSFCSASGKIFISELTNVDFVAFRTSSGQSRDYIKSIRAMLDNPVVAATTEVDAVQKGSESEKNELQGDHFDAGEHLALEDQSTPSKTESPSWIKANSVIHYHAVIHRALKYAVKIDLISVNPADKVERPKADKFIGSFYDSNEVQALFEAAKGTLIEIPIFLGAFYGLRRSEALGLKWDAIDFQNNTIIPPKRMEDGVNPVLLQICPRRGAWS